MTNPCDHKLHFRYICNEIYCTECHLHMWQWAIDDQLAVIAENSPYKPVDKVTVTASATIAEKQLGKFYPIENEAETTNDIAEWNTYMPKAKAQPVTVKRPSSQAIQPSF